MLVLRVLEHHADGQVTQHNISSLSALPALHTLHLIGCCSLSREHVREAVCPGSNLKRLHVDGVDVINS